MTSTLAPETLVPGPSGSSPPPKATTNRRSILAQAAYPSNDEKLNPQQEDLTKLAPWRKWSIFACSCLLQFLLNLDMASVAVALPV